MKGVLTVLYNFCGIMVLPFPIQEANTVQDFTPSKVYHGGGMFDLVSNVCLSLNFFKVLHLCSKST